MLGQYCLPDLFLYYSSLNEEKLLSNVNIAVRGQVKSENSSLPLTVRVSKKRVLMFPDMDLLQFKKVRM